MATNAPGATPIFALGVLAGTAISHHPFGYIQRQRAIIWNRQGPARQLSLATSALQCLSGMCGQPGIASIPDVR